jgi:hypothetical protein
VVTWPRFVANSLPRTGTFVTFAQAVIPAKAGIHERGGADSEAAVFMDPGSSPG